MLITLIQIVLQKTLQEQDGNTKECSLTAIKCSPLS